MLQGFEVGSRISFLGLYEVVRKVAADNARTWDLNSRVELESEGFAATLAGLPSHIMD